MNGFFLLWSEQSGNPTFKHQTEDSARIEAERLARENPGKIFHVLKLVDSCQKNDIVWASQQNDIPF